MGFFEDLKSHISALANGVLKKAREANSVETVEQAIRDLERSKIDVKRYIANAEGEKEIIERGIEKLIAQNQELDVAINIIMTNSDPNDDETQGGPLLIRQQGLMKRVDEEKKKLAMCDSVISSTRAQLGQVNQVHEEKMSLLTELRNKSRSSQTSDNLAQTLENVQRITGSMSGPSSVDNVLEGVALKEAQSRARLAQALDGVAPKDEVKDIIAKANMQKLIEERRAKLAQKQP